MSQAASPRVDRFLRSMSLSYGQWHDGEGYDLETLPDLTPEEKSQVLEVLQARLNASGANWRDVEAVAALGSAEARATLYQALRSHDADVRLRAGRFVAEGGEAEHLEGETVRLLRDPDAVVSINTLITQAAAHPTPGVRQALLDCAMDGHPDLRVHAAALALYLAGRASSEFDWNYRPLFLRFGQNTREERAEAMKELAVLMAGEK